jgi:hypothetical protein
MEGVEGITEGRAGASMEVVVEGKGGDSNCCCCTAADMLSCLQPGYRHQQQETQYDATHNTCATSDTGHAKAIASTVCTLQQN